MYITYGRYFEIYKTKLFHIYLCKELFCITYSTIIMFVYAHSGSRYGPRVAGPCSSVAAISFFFSLLLYSRELLSCPHEPRLLL
jgi:hypothetical protein